MNCIDNELYYYFSKTENTMVIKAINNLKEKRKK
jgi:hypothetical protein